MCDTSCCPPCVPNPCQNNPCQINPCQINHCQINPCQNLRYIQPKVRTSCKPFTAYQRSSTPIDDNTVYKTSYPVFNPKETEMCRSVTVRPTGNFNFDRSLKQQADTVTSISFPAHCVVRRQKPVVPCSRSLLGDGPMQDLTTQKHDYVAKNSQRRQIFRPCGQIRRTCEPLEKETVHRLSFSLPNPENTRSQSFKPTSIYQQPCAPMDVNTTQKMSYLPVCAQPREKYDWARKPTFSLPNTPVESTTTYGQSYLGDYCDLRKPLLPHANANMIVPRDACKFDDNTIYKESYFNTKAGDRPKPIRPTPNLNTNSDVKMDPDTMYSLAFPGHYQVCKQKPVVPFARSMLGEGPMQDLTTQKHDYVCKTQCRRMPIKPRACMQRTCGKLDSNTTAALSYMNPVAFVPSVSCKPTNLYQKPAAPMEMDTTQKLSYLPVCPPKKEFFEWTKKPTFKMPTQPMDTETVQQLSYAPPGRFVSDSTCCPVPQMSVYPRAAVC